MAVLSGVAENWLQPDNSFRKLALEIGPAQTGFSCATLAKGLDGFFRQLTRDNLHALLVQELGEARRLDVMTATDAEHRASRAATATGPEFLVHIAAGNIPNPTLMSMVLGLLAHSAQFVKCASGATLLPRLFAHSIYEADPKLGACLEVAEWRGGNAELEAALFEHADCVTATGSDETLAAIRAKLPLKTRFLGYGHRVSFGYVTHEVLSGLSAQKRHGARGGRRGGMESTRLSFTARHLRPERRRGVARKNSPSCSATNWTGASESEPRGELAAEHGGDHRVAPGFYEVRAASFAGHTHVAQREFDGMDGRFRSRRALPGFHARTGSFT